MGVGTVPQPQEAAWANKSNGDDVFPLRVPRATSSACARGGRQARRNQESSPHTYTHVTICVLAIPSPGVPASAAPGYAPCKRTAPGRPAGGAGSSGASLGMRIRGKSVAVLPVVVSWSFTRRLRCLVAHCCSPWSQRPQARPRRDTRVPRVCNPVHDNDMGRPSQLTFAHVVCMV